MRSFVLLGAGLLVSGCAVVVNDAPPTPTVPDEVSQAARQAPTPELEPYYQQILLWENCAGGNQCADLVVPLDYSDPSGPTISVAVLKNQATGSNSLGALVVNPGGPGGSGVDFAENASTNLTPQLHAAYDIVGFDPRGVGKSDPLECLTGPETDRFIAADATPDNPTDVAELNALSEQFAAACYQASPKLAGAISTRDVVRDLDVLRAALDEPSLDYLGFSYGTFIGANYAEQFPTRVGRFVLDGGIDPTLSNVQLAYGQALGFEKAFDRYAQSCIDQGNCPFGSSVPEIRQRVQQLLAQAEVTPLPTDDPNRPLTESLATLGILYPLYNREYGWPLLTQGLQEAFAGDGSSILSTIDLFNERNSNGTYASNSLDALYAVNCLDRPDRPGLAETTQLAEQWSQSAPLFGSFLAYGNLPCAYWEIPATDEPGAITAPGTPPIMVVGTEFDPATPVEWSQALASQLSDAVLVLAENRDGHTSYGSSSMCVNSTVNDFLIRGVVPNEPVVICN